MCECASENRQESFVYISQCVLQLHIMHLNESMSSSESVCVRACVLVGGLALNTLTHTKVTRMTHGDLCVRCPPAAQSGFCLKKEQLGSQFGSVHADISDRKLEQGDREKNIGIHNGYESRGSVLDDTGI